MHVIYPLHMSDAGVIHSGREVITKSVQEDTVESCMWGPTDFIMGSVHACAVARSFRPKPSNENLSYCSVEFIGLWDAIFVRGLGSNGLLVFQPALASLEPIQSQEVQGCREICHVLLAGDRPGVSQHFDYFLRALQSARLADTDPRYGRKVLFFFCSD